MGELLFHTKNDLKLFDWNKFTNAVWKIMNYIYKVCLKSKVQHVLIE